MKKGREMKANPLALPPHGNGYATGQLHRRAQTAVSVGLCLLLCCVAMVQATDYYVSATGGNDTYDGLAATWDGASGPKLTIQAAIATAATGATITVAQGTYTEAIDFDGKDLTVTGTDPTDPAVVAATILNGGGDGGQGISATAVTFDSGETAQAVLTGLTVTTDFGRGVYCSAASPTISYCQIIDNMSYAGGAFYLSQSNAAILHCLIRDNMTGMDGGGAIYSVGGSPTVRNCTVVDNTCGMGGAYCGGVGLSSGTMAIANCILWGNSFDGTPQQLAVGTGASASVAYSCFQGGQPSVDGTLTWGTGNLSSDPLFADAANDDHHLESTYGRWTGTQWTTDAQHSPSIDAGDPASAYSVEPAGNGSRVNMGAYGNTLQASLGGTPGPVFVFSQASVSVTENDTATVTVCISEAPPANLTATISFDTGSDTDLSVTGGASLSFTTTNYDTPQTVTLAAAIDDTDAADGTGTLRAIGTGVADATCAVAEDDDDFTLTVTAGAGGSATPVAPSVQQTGDVVNITATADADCTFDAWTGDTTGVADTSLATTTVTVTADTTVTATFVLPFVTYFVSATNGNDTYSGLAATWDGVDGPKQTIQAAIDAAYNDTLNNTELIIVDPGTYPELVDFRGLDITVTGTDPADSSVVATTVITGGWLNMGTFLGVRFESGEPAAATLQGVTVATVSGRGISCTTNSSPTVRDCVIRNNAGSMDAGGGAIYCSGGTPVFQRCLVYENSFFDMWAGFGGISLSGCDAQFLGCTIVDNTSGGEMDPISGGIHCSDSSPTIRDCILWGNTDSHYMDDRQIICQGTSTPTVSYSCIQGGYAAGTNITTSDPLFANADYHLQSTAGRWDGTQWATDAQDSPAIDAGNPTSAYADETAPNGTRANLGCYGNTPEASRTASAVPAFVLTPGTLPVPEGSTATFTVTLDQAPAADVAVAVSIASGDADITVSSGASFTLTTANWATGTVVTLAAAEDNDDTADGQTTIQVQATGLVTAQLVATEDDDDVTLTVTGGTPAGATIREDGATVTIVATPAGHYHFTEWTGDTTGVDDTTAATTTVTLSGDTALTAASAIDQHAVAATATHGTVTGTGTGTYDYGAQVQLTVTPDAGYHFTSWTGDVPAGDEGNNPLTLAVSGDLTLVAGCQPDTPDLVLTPTALPVPEGGTAQFAVTVSGPPTAETTVTVTVTVDSGDADITVAAGGTLTFTPANYATPQTVTLAAAEDNADTANGTAQILLSSSLDPATLTATEDDDDVTVTVTGGTPAGATIQEDGATVTIVATPADHYHFTEWTGDTTGVDDTAAATTTVTLSGDTALTAASAIDQHTLTIVSDHGTPAGAGTYNYGATASWSVTSPVDGTQGQRFVADQTGGDVLMDADQTVTITWTTQYYLDVPAVSNGTVAPASDWHDAGSALQLTATADLGYHFAGWQGDVDPADEQDNPLSVTLTAPVTLTATFARNSTTYWTLATVNGTTAWPGADADWVEVEWDTTGGWDSDLSLESPNSSAAVTVAYLQSWDRADPTDIRGGDFETDTVGQPPAAWTTSPEWTDEGTILVTDSPLFATQTRSLAVVGYGTGPQGMYSATSAFADDSVVQFAAYLPATPVADAILLRVRHNGVWITLATDANGDPALTIGIPGHEQTLACGSDLVLGDWNIITVSQWSLIDSDSDGLDDGWETLQFGNLLQDGTADADSDGLTDAQEYALGTNPNASDTDADGMPDAWEVANGLDPTDPADANGDLDQDGLTNADEIVIHGTDPTLADTDSDGMPDGWEVLYAGLDPLVVDGSLDLDSDGATCLVEYLQGRSPVAGTVTDTTDLAALVILTPTQ